MTLRALSLAAALCLAPLPLLADQIRVLAFGDSLTEGYGLPPGEGLVPQLQKWLRDRGHDVVVLNGGLAGDTTAGGRVRIGYSLARHKPDAVIVELGGNDLIFGLSAKGAEDNLDSIMSQAGVDDHPLLLVGIAKPEPNPDWAAIWPRLAAKHDALLYENLYAPLYTLPEAEIPAMLQADRTHPSADGVKRIVLGLGPAVEALIARVGQPSPAGG
ncbi:arylesterase [Paracoccus laeviglucosivorans]|uniref:Acyl-CoA thioesterase-1 n=1 Tax=Paracoccus laeviglucosivorans TaxID=1197861 RepID=A0A521ASZ2_9RHOB|nr:arylesterase [Paracoccus laeviglucosivorans]SMO37924.1 acyl-CoA thioesterase-1 [Paracoccus laeviglucosivorans]